MKVQLSTNLVPIFTGTYENIWEVIEYNEEGTEEVEVEYNHIDLMKSIAKTYQKEEKYILSKLNSPFIKSLHFTGDFTSPREYNFRTDVLDFDIEVNRAELIRTLKKLENNQELETFLHDHYTSYDGFISFTPNNYRELKKEIVNQGNEFEQAMGALIRFLAENNIDSTGGTSIEYMVYENWSGNGYGGLDYKIVKE